jgi:hypothetical protein
MRSQNHILQFTDHLNSDSVATLARYVLQQSREVVGTFQLVEERVGVVVVDFLSAFDQHHEGSQQIVDGFVFVVAEIDQALHQMLQNGSATDQSLQVVVLELTDDGIHAVVHFLYDFVLGVVELLQNGIEDGVGEDHLRDGVGTNRQVGNCHQHGLHVDVQSVGDGVALEQLVEKTSRAQMVGDGYTVGIGQVVEGCDRLLPKIGLPAD